MRPMSLRSSISYLWLFAAFGMSVAAQQPVSLDVSKIGPGVGDAVPDFSGTDQDGVARSLKGAAGPNGTMLVFFRSADW